MKAKNYNTPLTEELQKEFSNINLGELGIEFALNSIFTGTIPRQYGKMPLPKINESEGVQPKLLTAKEAEVDNAAREAQKTKTTIRIL